MAFLMALRLDVLLNGFAMKKTGLVKAPKVVAIPHHAIHANKYGTRWHILLYRLTDLMQNQ